MGPTVSGGMDLYELSAKVGSQSAGALLTASGVPVAGPVVEALLNELLGVQNRQAEAIERIDANVQRLVEGPWKTARLYLRRGRNTRARLGWDQEESR